MYYKILADISFSRDYALCVKSLFTVCAASCMSCYERLSQASRRLAAARLPDSQTQRYNDSSNKESLHEAFSAVTPPALGSACACARADRIYSVCSVCPPSLSAGQDPISR